MPAKRLNKCVAPNCNNRYTENPHIKYFKFPVNDDLCALWILKVQNPILKSRTYNAVRNNFCVCANHFEKTCFIDFQHEKLKKGAIPTIFTVPEKSTDNDGIKKEVGSEDSYNASQKSNCKEISSNSKQAQDLTAKKKTSIQKVKRSDFHEAPTIENAFAIPKSSLYWENPALFEVSKKKEVPLTSHIVIKQEIESDDEAGTPASTSAAISERISSEQVRIKKDGNTSKAETCYIYPPLDHDYIRVKKRRLDSVNILSRDSTSKSAKIHGKGSTQSASEPTTTTLTITINTTEPSNPNVVEPDNHKDSEQSNQIVVEPENHKDSEQCNQIVVEPENHKDSEDSDQNVVEPDIQKDVTKLSEQLSGYNETTSLGITESTEVSLVPCMIMETNEVALDVTIDENSENNVVVGRTENSQQHQVQPKKKNNNNGEKELKPKTFVFKKNKNLGLVIKSALKQCNFPKGTRLVRSIDFVEKGKAMYRIVLPPENDTKSKYKEIKITKKLTARKRQNSQLDALLQQEKENRSVGTTTDIKPSVQYSKLPPKSTVCLDVSDGNGNTIRKMFTSDVVTDSEGKILGTLLTPNDQNINVNSVLAPPLIPTIVMDKDGRNLRTVFTQQSPSVDNINKDDKKLENMADKRPLENSTENTDGKKSHSSASTQSITIPGQEVTTGTITSYPVRIDNQVGDTRTVSTQCMTMDEHMGCLKPILKPIIIDKLDENIKEMFTKQAGTMPTIITDKDGKNAKTLSKPDLLLASTITADNKNDKDDEITFAELDQVARLEESATLEKPIRAKMPNMKKLQQSAIWNYIAKMISNKFKKQYKKKLEYDRKTRAIKREKWKDKMRKNAVNELKDTHYVIDEELALKYMDKLYFTAKINSSPAKLVFIQHKLRPFLSKRTGRRYTLEDKIFALSLYKSVGKHRYATLEKHLPLPARKSMFSMLNKVPFLPGLNREVFENLKKSISKLNEEDKYCSLAFDEIALAEDAKSDHPPQSKWYAKLTCDRPPGDHVLVLMLRGVLRNWKQPVGFILNTGEVTIPDLVNVIKESIRLILEIGLKPISTIFNIKDSFIEAINYLKLETESYCLENSIENTYFGFLVDNVEIVPILNPLHLMKETRDSLLNYDIEYVQNGETKTASWEHILQLYSCDQDDDFQKKVCPRLNENSVLPKKIISARMDMCSQIFSQRVSSVMRKLATLSAEGIEGKASETADFLLIMDQVMDSFTGYCSSAPQGKPLKCLANTRSPHSTFWTEAIEIMSSWKYLDHDMVYTSLTIGDNWIATLLAYVYLKDKLLTQGIKSIPMRNFNNEPLDKFFDILCNEGQKPKNPTYYYFLISYRTFVLSNDYLHNCLVNDESEMEIPLDINRDYIYDEHVKTEEDIIPCCNQKECYQEV